MAWESIGVIVSLVGVIGAAVGLGAAWGRLSRTVENQQQKDREHADSVCRVEKVLNLSLQDQRQSLMGEVRRVELARVKAHDTCRGETQHTLEKIFLSLDRMNERTNESLNRLNEGMNKVKGKLGINGD